tara:strand:- start:477 stop:1322 length:846 start_codon:yes stop_codon:yes gene_type:complete
LIITSKNNPKIKRFRSFKDRVPSKEKEYFCIEGTHLLEELIKSELTPSELIATEEWISKNQKIIEKLDTSLITIVSREALTSSITTKSPDGVATLVKTSEIKQFNYQKNNNFVLVLDRVQDPGNLGNLFRMALAGGVDGILLGGGANPLNQKVLRASCGSLFHLPYKRIEGEEEMVIEKLMSSLTNFSKKGFQIILTTGPSQDPNISLKPYWELDWLRPTVLVLGNEGGGIHKKIKEAFHERVTIPHNELVESLNVACVAVPLLLERKRVTLTTIPKNKSD